MKLNRRELAAGLALLPLVMPGRAWADEEPQVGDDGLYKQDWFIESFLDLREDLNEAAAAGKHFAIMWEQRGCPYCRETHKVNFADPEIRDYIKANFNVLQLDLWGPRKVTDFDGKVMAEGKLGRRWGVNFTPTISFFAKSDKTPDGKSGRDLEVARMPGYFKPFHFISMFEYVRRGEYEKRPFQRFLGIRAEKLRKKGVEVKLW